MPRKRKRQATQDPNQLLLFSLEEMGGSPTLPPADEAENATREIPETTEVAEMPGTTEVAEAALNPEMKVETKEAASSDISVESEETTVQETMVEPPTAPAPETVVEPVPEWLEEDVVDLLVQVIKLLEDFDAGELRLIAMQSTALMQGGIRNDGIYRIPALPDIMLSGNVLKGIAYVSIVQSFPSMTDKIGLHWEKEYEEAIRKIDR